MSCLEMKNVFTNQLQCNLAQNGVDVHFIKVVHEETKASVVPQDRFVGLTFTSVECLELQYQLFQRSV